MEREIPHNDNTQETDESEIERRKVERAQAVYGDTDMNPNADDQRSAHHAEPDEHL